MIFAPVCFPEGEGLGVVSPTPGGELGGVVSPTSLSLPPNVQTRTRTLFNHAPLRFEEEEGCPPPLEGRILFMTPWIEGAGTRLS
jgi:hypothetical protein